MTLLAERELKVTAWPYLIAAPGTAWFSLLYLDPLDTARSTGTNLLFAVAATGAMLALELVLTYAWSLIARHHRSLRTNTASVAAYIAIAALAAPAYLAILGPLGPGQQEVRITLWIFFVLYLAPSMAVLAIIVQKVITATNRFRQVRDVANRRLQQVTDLNELLEAAEDRLQRESFSRVRDEVAGPLAEIASTASLLTDEEIACALQEVMDEHLRPLAHELHPITVRLGLITAVRALGPHHTITVDPAIARLDADGQLLDDNVRLQLYRWIRESLAATQASAITLTVRSRLLVVTMTTHGAPLSLDGIHQAAGLTSIGAGSVAAPLRGQPMPVFQLATRGTRSPRPRIDFWQAVTTPLPRRLLLVLLLLAGALPGQVVVALGVLNSTTVTVMLAWTLIPLGLTYSYLQLPRPSRNWKGGVRVIVEWTSIAVLAGVSYATITTAALPVTTVGGMFDDIARAAIRFTIPGLALTIAYGFAAVAESMLVRAEAELRAESVRRVDILTEAAHMEEAVAEGLHRTVQGRVAAIIVMLRVHERSEALAYLDDLTTRVIPPLLARLRPQAVGTTDILVDVPPTMAMRLVGAVPDLPGEILTDVRRVIGEAAVNARRHGGATELEIKVTLDEGQLTVACTDNGRSALGASSPGLGSRVFDQVCIQRGGSWSLTAVPAGHRLELRCPVTPAMTTRQDVLSDVNLT